MKRLLVLAALLVFAESPVEARVFNFAKTGMSTYLRGAYGLNKMQKYAYEPGLPTTLSFPDTNGVNQNYAVELGFALATGKVTTRFGAQLLYPQLTSGQAGKNAAGTTLVSVTSQVYALIPKIDFEYALKQSQSFKVFFGIGGGYGYVTLRNSVSVTTSGQAVYPGITEYTELGSASTVMGEAYLGFELSLFDNVGFAIDGGYQYLPVTTISASQSTVTLTGTETKGSKIINTNGTDRTFDISNYFAGGSFRIYFN